MKAHGERLERTSFALGLAILRLQRVRRLRSSSFSCQIWGPVLRSISRNWEEGAHGIPGGHVVRARSLIQSVTGRTTGGFPVTATLAPPKR